MGGEVVLGRWCKHLSGARYVFVGMILHQMGGNGCDRFVSGGRLPKKQVELRKFAEILPRLIYGKILNSVKSTYSRKIKRF
jgi:hypothetical protein